MLAVIAIGSETCTYDGERAQWDCDDSLLKELLNRHTSAYQEFEYSPAEGDPVLAVVFDVLQAFQGRAVTLPPVQIPPGEGVN
jgi:hypothetical protein